jgi:hypothetical protein
VQSLSCNSFQYENLGLKGLEEVHTLFQLNLYSLGNEKDRALECTHVGFQSL